MDSEDINYLLITTVVCDIPIKKMAVVLGTKTNKLSAK